MASVQKKKKKNLKTQMSVDFKFHQKVGTETLKFLCNIVNQINKYLLSAYYWPMTMMNMDKDKSRVGHVPRELAHLICLKN